MKTSILTLLAALSLICFAREAIAQDKVSEKPKATGSSTTGKPSTSKPSVPSMQIGSMKRDDFVPNECGCAYYNTTSKREDGPLLMWINQQGAVSVKVDGRDRKLKIIKEERVQNGKNPSQSKIVVGDRVLMTLKGETLSASIINIAERNCNVGAACTHFTWQSTVSLSEYDARKSLKAWAICGCPGRKIFTAEQPKTEG